MLRLPAFEHLRAESVRDAAGMLADHGGTARLLAGGTDLLAKMKRRQVMPDALVGIGHLAPLREVRVAPSGAAELGAAVTLAEALADRRLAADQPGYLEAVGVVSSPALRNAGTIGGNLCVDTRCNYNDMTEEWRHAVGYCLKTGCGERCQVAASSPRCWAIFSSDTAPMAIALGATVVVWGAEGERELPLGTLYADDGKAHLQLGPAEILTALRLPARRGWRVAYEKLRRRSAVDFPLAGAAVALELDGDVVAACRLVLGAVASHPVELHDVAQALTGRRLDDEAIEEAATAGARLAKPLDNSDLNYVWRKRMVKVILERALRRAAGADRGRLR
jgi:4-hydroxybenzoyl-CoA reductase subunit beta